VSESVSATERLTTVLPGTYAVLLFLEEEEIFILSADSDPFAKLSNLNIPFDLVLWRKSSTAKWQNGELTNFQYLMVFMAQACDCVLDRASFYNST